MGYQEDIIIKTLTEKIRMMEVTHTNELESSYREGFHAGLKIELHVANFDDIDLLSPQTIKEAREGIKNQIVDGFKCVLPRDILKWVRDSVHESNLLEYNSKFSNPMRK